MRVPKFLGWCAMGMTSACLALPATAQVSEKTPDYSGATPADFASEEIMKEVATGGVPMGRWKEGLLFEGISPQPWLKSAANWFPGTEEVQPEEMRITFMGTAPMLRPGQMNTSIYVELGNGDTFIFDMGEGAVSNYLGAGVSINQLNDIFPHSLARGPLWLAALGIRLRRVGGSVA